MILKMKHVNSIMSCLDKGMKKACQDGNVHDVIDCMKTKKN